MAMLKLMLILTTTVVQSGLSNPLLTDISPEMERSVNIFNSLRVATFYFFFISRETTEGKEDVETFETDFTDFFNWNYFWFAVIPIIVLVCCLRHYCCSKWSSRGSQAQPVVLGQTSPPQYNNASNTFNTNFKDMYQHMKLEFTYNQSKSIKCSR